VPTVPACAGEVGISTPADHRPPWLALGYPVRPDARVHRVRLVVTSRADFTGGHLRVREPGIAVLLGALLAAEPLTGAILLGGATIVVGVVLVVSKERVH
jgi:hypothetical protein